MHCESEQQQQLNSKSVLPAGLADSGGEAAGTNHPDNIDDGCSGKFFHHRARFSQYQGFWYGAATIGRVRDVQEHFKAEAGDILLCSAPKAGTTWLKSLAFAICTRRNQYGSSGDWANNPLLTTNAQALVPYIELDNLAEFPAAGFGGQGRRLLSTHIPYSSLNDSIAASCKIIYICRDPKDVVVSLWYFATKLFGPIPFEKMLEIFCEGTNEYGPYWDHILSFWKASLKHPDKVMFLKYESDTYSYVKKMAEFMGCPFSLEEAKDGVVESIVTLCSFKNLSSITVNKTGKYTGGLLGRPVNNIFFFRKGIVGDWKNHLSPEMKDAVDNLTRVKFQGYNLSFTDDDDAHDKNPKINASRSS